MATRISDLNAASTLTGAELVPVVQDGNTVKATADQFKTTNASDLTSGTVDITLLPVASTSSAGIGIIGTSAGTLCDGADSRLSDQRVPTGSAGGRLAGTYPNPTLADSGVVAGTYGSSTSVPVVVIAEDGTVTSASNIPISSSAGGTVTSVGLSSNDLSVSGSPIIDAGTIQVDLNSIVASGTHGTWNQVPVITNDAKGRITAISTSTIPVGLANGVASLDSGGKVPSGQLPSFVDDIIEVANYAALPATGETGKIYVTLDTNLTYRWSGSVYVQVDSGPTPSSTTPIANSNAGGVGTSLAYARADHYHPAITLASLGGAKLVPDVNVQTGTSYTLALADSGSAVTLNNSSAITLTIPANSSVAFGIGTQILIMQIGPGQVTVSPASGVTLLSPSSKTKTASQYSVATLVQVAANTWVLGGDTTV